MQQYPRECPKGDKESRALLGGIKTKENESLVGAAVRHLYMDGRGNERGNLDGTTCHLGCCVTYRNLLLCERASALLFFLSLSRSEIKDTRIVSV